MKYARSDYTNHLTIDTEAIVVEFPIAVLATAFVIEVFVIELLLFKNCIEKVKGTPLIVSIHFG